MLYTTRGKELSNSVFLPMCTVPWLMPTKGPLFLVLLHACVCLVKWKKCSLIVVCQQKPHKHSISWKEDSTRAVQCLVYSRCIGGSLVHCQPALPVLEQCTSGLAYGCHKNALGQLSSYGIPDSICLTHLWIRTLLE